MVNKMLVSRFLLVITKNNERNLNHVVMEKPLFWGGAVAHHVGCHQIYYTDFPGCFKPFPTTSLGFGGQPGIFHDDQFKHI